MLQMTRAEYQAKYGTQPQASPTPQPPTQPIQMTRQQYQQKYGALPGTQPTRPVKPRSVGGFIENVGKSGVRAVSDTINAIAHPIQTGKALLGLGAGAVSKLIPGRQQSEDNVDAVVDFYKQRYGKDLGKTLYEDPVGVLMDASTLAGGAGAALKGVGAVGKMGAVSKAGKVLTTVSRVTDPFEIAARGVGKVAGKVASKVPSAESIYFRGIGSPKKLEKVQGIAKAAGYSDASEVMQKYGLAGRSAEKAKDVAASLGKEYYQTAGKQNKFASLTDVMNSLDDQIKKIINSDYAASDEGQTVLAELQRRKQLMEARFGQTGRVPGGGQTQVPLGELAEFRKKALDPDIKFDMTRPAAKTKATKVVRDVIREEINKVDPRLKEIGMDELLIEKLIPILESYQARGTARQLFNFTKLGGAGIGAIAQGIPGAISGFVVEQLANNPRVLAALSQLRKTKIPGTDAAKLFSKGAYLFGKASRGLKTDQLPTLVEDRKKLQSSNSILHEPQNKTKRLSFVDRYAQEANDPESEVYKLNKQLYDPMTAGGLVGSVAPVSNQTLTALRAMQPSKRLTQLLNAFYDLENPNNISKGNAAIDRLAAEVNDLLTPQEMEKIKSVFEIPESLKKTMIKRLEDLVSVDRESISRSVDTMPNLFSRFTRGKAGRFTGSKSKR